MQNTDNFDLKIYEGEDLFNPLVVENANAQAIDNQMKKNENHTVGDATELVSGTVHALTRLTPDTPMLRFTATSRFTAGDTFTVDGVQVSALTVSGEQLPDGAYIIGSEVLAYLKGTLLTFFTSQGTLATAQNALKLGGNTPEYYATSTEVQTAQNTATAAGNLANEINSNLDIKPICTTNNESMNVLTYQSGAFIFFDIYIKKDIPVEPWTQSIYEMYAGKPKRVIYVLNSVNPLPDTRIKITPDGSIVCSGSVVPRGGTYQGCYIVGD